jgi:hypothetical protein
MYLISLNKKTALRMHYILYFINDANHTIAENPMSIIKQRVETFIAICAAVRIFHEIIKCNDN